MLTIKLNKYLINIIDEYNTIDIDKLIEKDQKEKLNIFIVLNPTLTIEDIIIKAIHNGYICSGNS